MGDIREGCPVFCFFFHLGNFLHFLFFIYLLLGFYNLLYPFVQAVEIKLTSALYFFLHFRHISSVPRKGPEGGRTGAADKSSPEKKITTDPTASAAQILSSASPQMTIVVLHVPNIRHMWLFQRAMTWCHLRVGHICSLLLWF